MYVDGLVERDRDASGTGILNERIYPLQDANFSATALVESSRALLERYSYSPFGAVTVLAADWNFRSTTSYSWVYNFQGTRHESSTGTYHFRLREYCTLLGMFTSRDPIGIMTHLIPTNSFALIRLS